MKVYIKLDKFITTISRIISYIGSAWIFAIMLIIVFDVGGRSLFDQPFVGTTEIVRNSVVGIAFFLVPWGYGQRYPRQKHDSCGSGSGSGCGSV